jgi:hypothetical protein
MPPAGAMGAAPSLSQAAGGHLTRAPSVERPPCGSCGGPKTGPVVPGSMLCDVCRAHGEALRLCRGCGAEKGRGGGRRLCDACQAAKVAAVEERRRCTGCGAAKSPGKGNRLCDGCRQEEGRVHSSDLPEYRRRPCSRCGGPKPPGRAQKLCDGCRAADVASGKVKGLPMPCHACGSREGKRPRRQYCDECHELKEWQWRQRKIARQRAARKPCRTCGGIKPQGSRSKYCGRCTPANRRRRCACGVVLERPRARKCEPCLAASRREQAERNRTWARRVAAGEHVPRPQGPRRRPRRAPQGVGHRSLPAAPMAAFVRRRLDMAKREHLRVGYGEAGVFTDEGILGRWGVSDRTVRDWEAGLRATVNPRKADEVLTRMGAGWWEVWEPERFPDLAPLLGGDR